MKELRLLRGEIALVDDEDYDRLAQFSWFVVRQKDGYFRVVRQIPTDKRTPRGDKRYAQISMAAEIMQPPPGMLVDHKDRNPFNNRRENLRICTHQQNSYNASPRRGSTSQYKGVSYCRRDKSWVVAIRVNKKRIPLGYFKDEVEAAKAYDRAAHRHHGEFAVLNFPEESELRRVFP